MTKIELFNLALGRIGIRPLTGPDDERQEAVFCNQFFPSALDEVLDLASFACSLKRTILARLAEKPDFEFLYAYSLPTDFLHIVRMEKETPFALESGRLLCNLEQCAILYVRRVKDTSELPPHAANCVVLNLAAKLATALSNNPSLAERMLNELYNIALPNARTSDTMQKHSFSGHSFWTSPKGECNLWRS